MIDGYIAQVDALGPILLSLDHLSQVIKRECLPHALGNPTLGKRLAGSL